MYSHIILVMCHVVDQNNSNGARNLSFEVYCDNVLVYDFDAHQGIGTAVKYLSQLIVFLRMKGEALSFYYSFFKKKKKSVLYMLIITDSLESTSNSTDCSNIIHFWFGNSFRRVWCGEFSCARRCQTQVQRHCTDKHFLPSCLLMWSEISFTIAINGTCCNRIFRYFLMNWPSLQSKVMHSYLFLSNNTLRKRSIAPFCFLQPKFYN